MVRKATPDRGGPRKTPDGVDPNIKRTRKTQRDGHNSGVKIWSLCSVSSTLSHANLEQPFRTLAIKWEVNIFVKKSSCVFLPALSFMHLSLLLCRCDAAWTCKWLYNISWWSFMGEWVTASLLKGSVKAMNCGIVVTEFELQSHYYIPFRRNTLRKGMSTLILPGWNSTTVHLEGLP